MKIKSPYIFLAIIIFTVTACKKISDTAKSRVKSPVDVYVAGKVLAQNGNFVAAYWKNGVLTKVADTTYSSLAESITVVGSDVYIIGSFSDGSITKAMYWKNGSPVILANGNVNITSNSAGSIAVDGNNVYVVGTATLSNYQHIAVSWTNGTITQLTQSPPYYSYANTVMVNNGNVYVTGATTALNGNSVATYWLNGTAKKLTDSTANSLATGIAFSGNNVYISGYGSPNGRTAAIYWKNGQQNILPGAYYSAALTVWVDGNDVYLGGQIGFKGSLNTQQAAYWVNGAQTTVGSIVTSAYCSFISEYGNNIGISGQFGSHPAAYWLNGSFVPLTGTSAYCSSIALVPK